MDASANLQPVEELELNAEAILGGLTLAHTHFYAAKGNISACCFLLTLHVSPTLKHMYYESGVNIKGNSRFISTPVLSP